VRCRRSRATAIWITGFSRYGTRQFEVAERDVDFIAVFRREGHARRRDGRRAMSDLGGRAHWPPLLRGPRRPPVGAAHEMEPRPDLPGDPRTRGCVTSILQRGVISILRLHYDCAAEQKFWKFSGALSG
jgi:hypothetical protein